jgi:hypothetical protein
VYGDEVATNIRNVSDGFVASGELLLLNAMF